MSECKESFGGGSGGGGVDPGGGNHFQTVEGAYTLHANQIELLSTPPLPPVVPGTCVITLLATGGKGGVLSNSIWFAWSV